MYRKEIKAYAQEINRQRMSVISKNKHKYSKFWDYPACISICYGLNKKKRKRKGFAKGYSHRPEGTRWATPLERKLSSIGSIGHPTKYCDNILGNCAEQHSANNYMNQYHELCLSNLYFSPTIRPRTGQVIDACSNCKYIFPNI